MRNDESALLGLQGVSALMRRLSAPVRTEGVTLSLVLYIMDLLMLIFRSVYICREKADIQRPLIELLVNPTVIY